ncbi:MAG: hypothetical protein RIT45_1400 [Pseudomonadota bacterium]|jgi:hypothetical protein
MNLIELKLEERRQIIDSVQAWQAWNQRKTLLRRRYAGSMRWLQRSGRDYLHRKIGTRERSLGPRSAETEAAYDAFLAGRASAREAATQLAAEVERRAKILRAMGLGRVPTLTARILRKLDEHDLQGTHLLVAGTNALYAYEAAAGLHITSELLATRDVDLLWDARQRLSLVVPEVRRRGILSLLQQVDRSFEPLGKGDYRASNAEGFWVDLIRAEDAEFRAGGGREHVGEQDDDLRGAPIAGLQWLVSAPRFEATAIAEDGRPVRIVTVDPRAFALHKRWLAEQPERERIKVPRDRGQSAVTLEIATEYLGLPLDDAFLRGMPGALVHARP